MIARTPVPYRLPGQQPRPTVTPSRVAVAGPGGFGAKTNPVPAPKPIPRAGMGKGSAPIAGVPTNTVGQQPTFNFPQQASSPIQQYQPPVTAQTPVGGFQTPPPMPNIITGDGNLGGSIQTQPMPITPVAMPTPNPVPPPVQQQQPISTPAPAQPPITSVAGPGGPASLSPGPFQGAPVAGPSVQDYINMGIDPVTAQSMMSGTYTGGAMSVPVGPVGQPISGGPIMANGGMMAFGAVNGPTI
jgi:hypothetical protein